MDNRRKRVRIGPYQNFDVRIDGTHLLNELSKGSGDLRGRTAIGHIVCSEMEHDHVWRGRFKPTYKLVLVGNVNGLIAC